MNNRSISLFVLLLLFHGNLTSGSVPVCITWPFSCKTYSGIHDNMEEKINVKLHKSEKEPKRESKLRPDAPVFVPFKTIPQAALILPTQALKEAQCSRYSRKSVWRMEENGNSPRPILGSKNHLPRPILGRKENIQPANEEDYMGKQFKSIYRRMLRMKISDENRKKHETKPKVKS